MKEEATTHERKDCKIACDLYRKAKSFAKSIISKTVSDAVFQKVMDQVTTIEAWDAHCRNLIQKIACIEFHISVTDFKRDGSVDNILLTTEPIVEIFK